MLPSLEVAGPGGHWVEVSRAICPGEPSDDTKRMFEAYDEYFEAAPARASRRLDRARRPSRRREGLPRPRLPPRPRHRPLDRDDDDRVPEDRRGRRDGARRPGWCSRCTRMRSRPTGRRASTCRTRGSSPRKAACRSPVCRCGSSTAPRRDRERGTGRWRRPTSSHRSCAARRERLRALPAHGRAALAAEDRRRVGAPRRAALLHRAPGVGAVAEARVERGRGGDTADRGARARGRPAPARPREPLPQVRGGLPRAPRADVAVGVPGDPTRARSRLRLRLARLPRDPARLAAAARRVRRAAARDADCRCSRCTRTAASTRICTSWRSC